MSSCLTYNKTSKDTDPPDAGKQFRFIKSVHRKLVTLFLHGHWNLSFKGIGTLHFAKNDENNENDESFYSYILGVGY